MDPNYSVLVGDKTKKDECEEEGEEQKDDEKGGVNARVIYIVVPLVVGLVAISALAVLAAPKYFLSLLQ